MTKKQGRFMSYIQFYPSPLGLIVMTSDGSRLTGLYFENQKYYPADEVSSGRTEQLPVFDMTRRWLDLYFSGKIPDFLPSCAPRGTQFQRSVWEKLSGIAYGQTCTYGIIADEIAAERGLQKMAAQAVGAAVGHNPISIIIPCHRVIGSDGSLTGYAGGLQRKSALLTLEYLTMHQD